MIIRPSLFSDYPFLPSLLCGDCAVPAQVALQTGLFLSPKGQRGFHPQRSFLLSKSSFSLRFQPGEGRWGYFLTLFLLLLPFFLSSFLFPKFSCKGKKQAFTFLPVWSRSFLCKNLWPSQPELLLHSLNGEMKKFRKSFSLTQSLTFKMISYPCWLEILFCGPSNYYLLFFFVLMLQRCLTLQLREDG